MVNLSQINEVKIEEVSRLIEIAKGSEVIKRIIIFGSTVTDSCDEDSDIDVCLDIACDTKDQRLYRHVVDFDKACNYNCDIFFYHQLGTTLKNEIDKKGVSVYVA